MEKRASIVVGLGFGDEGKGSIVDFLCRDSSRPPVVVRFNGGSQAAHNVVTSDGRHHTFAQLGSGSFVPGVRSHLSRFMLLDPFALAQEARALQPLIGGNPLERLSVDSRCKLITPFQRAANRLREALRKKRHGSCGMGVGETVADSLATPSLVVTAADLQRPLGLQRGLREIQSAKLAELGPRLEELGSELRGELDEDIRMLSDSQAPALFAEALVRLGRGLDITESDHLARLAAESPLVFEGAQGVLLDEWYGFHPYTTWSTTTTANALVLLEELDYDAPVERIGVLRAYHTRHGAGPFPSEAPKLRAQIDEPHNGVGPWQGAFRLGHFDAVLARYALEVCEVDSLALTNLDRLAAVQARAVLSYRSNGNSIERLPLKTELEDLGHQERLTAILEAAQPVSRALPGAEELLAGSIAELCEKPIAILSRGPTAADKCRLLRRSAAA